MDADKLTEERRKYVMAFNNTMVKIWKEKIIMLDAVRTGDLYNSVCGVRISLDDKVLDITLEQSFNTYGLFVDYGTGSNTWRGNPGDIGRDNNRRRKQWFSRKYYASVMNLQEMFADSVGKQFCKIVSAALDPDNMRAQISL